MDFVHQRQFIVLEFFADIFLYDFGIFPYKFNVEHVCKSSFVFQIAAEAERVDSLTVREKEVEERIKVIMMTIPNIIDPSVPIGKDDSENVEVEKFGDRGQS